MRRTSSAPSNRREYFWLLVAMVVTAVSVAAGPALGSFSVSSSVGPYKDVTFSVSTPGPPTGLECQWVTDGSAPSTKINFSWTLPSTTGDGFKIGRSTDGTSFTDEHITAAGASTTTASETAANSPTSTTYYYRNATYAGGGSPPWMSAFQPSSSPYVRSTRCRDAAAQLTPGNQNTQLSNPYDVTTDSTGNVYIADTNNNQIRMIPKVTGTYWGISMVAGNSYLLIGHSAGTAGSCTTGTAIPSCSIKNPRGVSVAPNRDLLIADTGNSVIRVVPAAAESRYGVSSMSANTVYIIAGQSGQSGSTGDGGAALSAKLSTPADVAADSNGNVFIADSGSDRIREVSNQTNTQFGVSMTAGNLYGIVTSGIGAPSGISVRSDGDVFFSDKGNNLVKVIASAAGHTLFSATSNSASGTVYTVAGGGGASPGSVDGTAATSAKLSSPWGVDLDSGGNLLISDSGNSFVNVVVASGQSPYGISSPTANAIYRLGGNGSAAVMGDGYPDTVNRASSPTTSGNITTPQGISADKSDTRVVYAVDNAKHNVRRIDTNDNAHLLLTWAGRTAAGGPDADGTLAHAYGVTLVGHSAVDSSGNLYFADKTDNRIRQWMAATGYVRTIAGLGGSAENGDGANALLANLNSPQGVALDSSGNVYSIDAASGLKLRKITMSSGAIGNISTVVGVGTGCTTSCADGGAATSAKFQTPADVAIDGNGNYFITDSGNCTVRFVYNAGSNYYGISSPTAGYIYKIAGTYGTCSSTATTLFNPDGIDLDSSGNLYVAERGGVKIRKITASGTLSDFAGTGTSCGSTGDGAAATSATLCNPYDVAWNSSNSSLYITDSGNVNIRCVATTSTAACGQSSVTAGYIYLVAGGGAVAPGNGGWAQDAILTTPKGISVKGGGTFPCSMTSPCGVYVSQTTANTDLRLIFGPDP